MFLQKILGNDLYLVKVFTGHGGLWSQYNVATIQRVHWTQSNVSSENFHWTQVAPKILCPLIYLWYFLPSLLGQFESIVIYLFIYRYFVHWRIFQSLYE